MAKDFLRFVTGPSDVLKALRRISLRSLIALSGLSLASPPAAASVPQGNQAPALAPLIVDRSKKAAKLVLTIPGKAFGGAQHRSHRSHSSHRSSSSGGTAAPVVRTPAPAPAPPPKTTAPPATLAGVAPLMSATEADATTLVTGVVESIDRTNRRFFLKPAGGASRRFAYRDDTSFETPSGGNIRFDEFADMSEGRLPLSTGDKVRVRWRISTDGQTTIAVAVRKTP